MNNNSDQDGGNSDQPKPLLSREERLKAALKANMARRKAQARARGAAALARDDKKPDQGIE